MTKEETAPKPPISDEAWLQRPDPAYERRFLRGRHENAEELATAGHVFLEFVRGFGAHPLSLSTVVFQELFDVTV
jgi:hypothetical protein